MELHSSALGDAPAKGKLNTAKEALAAARKALHIVATRSLVLHLVSLASQHFPELLTHDEAQQFMDIFFCDGGAAHAVRRPTARLQILDDRVWLCQEV